MEITLLDVLMIYLAGALRALAMILEVLIGIDDEEEYEERRDTV